MLSVFDQGPAKPCPAPFNMAAHVLRKAEEHAEKKALSILRNDGSEDWSYRELKSAILGTGTGLLKAGLRPGDLVLLRLGNSVEFPIAYLAAIAVGIVPIPTSSQLTETETGQIIEDLSPTAVLRDPEIACAPHTYQITLDELASMRDLSPAEFEMGDPNRLCYVIYTSGTSGKPRAVAHAHRAIWARQMMVDGWYGLSETDRLCHAGAFNWTYTLGTGLMDPWTIGATALIPKPGTDLTNLPRLLQAHRATIFAAAPGVFRKLLQNPNLPEMPDLRHGLCAGEKLSRHLHEHWSKSTGTELYEAYGMSECSTFISSSPSHPARDEALGRPQLGRRIAIVGPNGPVPQGQEGTIAIHREDPGLMLTYLNAPNEAEAKMQGEWFLTGDQGAMAVDGQITYLGRDDDMMNAGGYRVSPVEVEAVLARYPGITQVGAAAVEVKQDSAIIAVFYTGPEKLDENALRTYVSEKLARYKQPRAFVHLSAMPTGGNGKLLRRALPAYFKASVE
ncbi:class I adenylate-forming enzyme family protein [Ruegeria arenilitoris]|uniref:class I adenylate-forming enzyme family protein n=1 Tax=Ruegeria arenilitoris TaxID=1173585 RepID=UPI00147CCEAF|nr:class I adenylate-forming enzyme family protein [Ruegeria arenilitoris]